MDEHSRTDRIQKALSEVSTAYGPWTAHSIHVGHGVHTFQVSPDSRLRQIMQTACDLLGGIKGRRVLDLACLEGQLGIECALQGADVLAVEARQANLAKAEVAKNLLRLSNLELRLGDVRDLNSSNSGRFDLILCAGILYHLDAGDAAELLRNLSEMCQGLLIVDTHTSPMKDSYDWNDHTYFGQFRKEHAQGLSADKKAAALWYSVDNERAFQFTESSLCNILQHVGFTSVLKCMLPHRFWYERWPEPSGRQLEMAGRITLVAVKGDPVHLFSSPATNDLPQIDRPEVAEFFGYERPRDRWLRRLRKIRMLLSSRRGEPAVSLHWEHHPTWPAPKQQDSSQS